MSLVGVLLTIFFALSCYNKCDSILLTKDFDPCESLLEQEKVKQIEIAKAEKQKPEVDRFPAVLLMMGFNVGRFHICATGSGTSMHRGAGDRPGILW